MDERVVHQSVGAFASHSSKDAKVESSQRGHDLCGQDEEASSKALRSSPRNNTSSPLDNEELIAVLTFPAIALDIDELDWNRDELFPGIKDRCLAHHTPHWMDDPLNKTFTIDEKEPTQQVHCDPKNHDTRRRETWIGFSDVLRLPQPLGPDAFKDFASDCVEGLESTKSIHQSFSASESAANRIAKSDMASPEHGLRSAELRWMRWFQVMNLELDLGLADLESNKQCI